ncbi:YihY/virulence factor BrkB family protein [Sphingomonas sp. BGYR3]|uniref:YihY/virulence factor BrkB family protein n=1 Tax=Sphingomonas sp. BGYR3 TaxID=2975483 RepID=UPI0021A37EBB|nr:YihY/virulence factor BrkB family protein [Sphingomonas sp. BGYR3]MDG5488164.1 YihY/virulence factor BrkB family protein [Sphingomonas sp. BGYR3]
MTEGSSQTPEARREQGGLQQRLANLGISQRVFEVAKRVVAGVFAEGFTHAGNLAYLSLVTLFPFFIVAAAIARLFGRTEDGLRTVEAFLRTMPPDVALVLQKPILDVLQARSGSLLWLGAIVGLWTTASFVETLRAIQRQAYGVKMSRPFWEYRLSAIGMIFASVILAMTAFSFQVALTGVEAFITQFFPFATDIQTTLSLSRFVPGIALFAALYILFYALTPGVYRRSNNPKWPGAALTTGWWLATTALLPIILTNLANYDLTYGSLAGVMIALIFFFIVGLGVVVGAQLNAALAESPETGLESASNKDLGAEGNA